MIKALTHSEFENRVYEVLSRNDLKLLETYVNHKTTILVETKYGIHRVLPQRLLKGCLPDIRTAVDKTGYYVKLASEIHNNEYIYEDLIYKNANTHVKIKCHLHGVFSQNPSSHLLGYGCIKCGSIKLKEVIRKKEMSLKEKFLELGTGCNYSKMVYKGYYDKIEVICPIHGNFWQSIHNHIVTKGCPKCSRLKKLYRKSNKEEFVEKAELLHNGFYSYLKTKYISAVTKTTITCPMHGDFLQSPNSHLSGHGCKKCIYENLSKKLSDNPIGWRDTHWIEASKRSKNFDSFKVYLIRCWNESEEFYKIGKTFMTVNNRFNQTIGSKLPYNYEIESLFIFDCGKKCSRRERLLKGCNKINRYVPKISFPGFTECFKEIDSECLNSYK